MASIAFPSLAKKATLSSGMTYGYVAVAAATLAAPGVARPTFLLLHGYPSSSYDWRHQIKSLSSAGFGVIAPDLLGYGDTDKPDDVASYRFKAMSKDMADILDLEGVSQCIAVGHDWGCGLLSRLATYVPDRLLGIVPISVGYIEPGMDWDIDAFNRLTEQLVGYSTYGYWPWHNTDEAVNDCDKNPASVFTLIYASDPENWKVNLAPVGAAARYVRTGCVDALPAWYTLDEYTTRDRVFSTAGYKGPMSWYKAAMRGVNSADEAEVSEKERICKVPTLLIVSDQDYVTRADMQIMTSKKSVQDLRVEILVGCGHWIQLERAEELHRLLEAFATEAASGLVDESVTPQHAKEERKLDGYTAGETEIIDSTHSSAMAMPISFNWDKW